MYKLSTKCIRIKLELLVQLLVKVQPKPQVLTNVKVLPYNLDMEYKEYAVPISKKGQITLPKELRDSVGITLQNLVLVSREGSYLRVSKTKDILDLAGSVKAPADKRSLKGILKAREYMQTHYERI